MPSRHDSPSGFVVSREGDCSFCGKQGWEICALAKAAGRPERICCECVVLCLDITNEEFDNREPNKELAAELRRLDTHRGLMEQMGRAMAFEDVDAVIALVRQMGRDVDPETVRAWMRGEPDSARADFDLGRYQRPTPESCSFCGALCEKINELISGPGVAICMGCVDAAATDLLSALRI